MKQSMLRFLGIFFGGLLLGAVTSRADVKLPPVFSDHMVLQRDQAVPVWGDAKPGEKITVKFRHQEKSTVADDKGKWQLKLDPLTVGGSDKLTVSGDNTVEIHDVLVGEVWVGSGQSNMEMEIASYVKNDPELAAYVAAAPYPQIRYRTSGGRWQLTETNTINKFSALLFSFGVRVQKELGVPVGLMLGAVSGTPSGPWCPPDAFKANAACQAAVKQYTATTYVAALTRYDKEVADWSNAVALAKEQQKPVPKPPIVPSKPGAGATGNLYAQFIRPMMPYGIRGVLWDQGESGTAVTGVDQYTLMGALISGWRHDWGQGDFPFIYVQKPSGYGCAYEPTNAVNRSGEKFAPLPPSVPTDGVNMGLHIKIMNYPNTTMAISSDLGQALHPPNKSGYGHRAADVALGFVYGKPIEYYGPKFDSFKIEGAAIRVKFTHVGEGLTFAHGDKLQGFAIAGEDKKWFWADAKIDGATVVLSSAEVKQPAYVLYAWSSLRQWANFFNKDGLPAISFRTDE